MLMHALLLIVGGSAAMALPQSSIDLSGTWQSIALPVPGYPPSTASGWAAIEIPRPVNPAPWVCQRRSFEIPEQFVGQRLYLRFLGVKYTAQVRCNGQVVGEHVGGYEPFECDITEVANIGGTNEVEVLCGSWRQLTTDPDSPGTLRRDDIEERQDWILYPIGSQQSMGIWDTVTLEARPPVYVEDVYVTTSVRKSELATEITIRNTTQEKVWVTVRQRVMREGTQVFGGLTPLRGQVEAGSSLRLTNAARWETPPLWWPHDPVLMNLETTLDVGGQAADQHRQRFGFREMWADGEAFVLNGVRLHLLGSACHPLGYTREDAQRTYDICRRGNINAFRLHAQPWSQAWYDVADETGMLLIHESAVWCFSRAYALGDERFWNNFANHIRAQIKLHRNRPSVFAWSLENEILHCGGNRVVETEQRLAALATVARETDRTRLINYDGDEDPSGAADIINLHYPHEFPQNRLWPNTCYWLDKPTRVEGWPRREWLWSREKPLYIGEYLWSPSSTPDRYTLFFGDDTYTDIGTYRRTAKAQAWRYQIEAYRAQGMSGGCPWNIFEGGAMDPAQNPMYHQATLAYRPQCALIREWNTRFFSGAEVKRTVTFINDVLRSAKLRAEWFCKVGDHETFHNAIDLDMQPADIIRRTLPVTVPEVPKCTPFEMIFTLSEKGREIFREVRPCWAMPREEPPQMLHSNVVLYDPGGKTEKALRDCGVNCSKVEELSKLPEGVKCLLIGEGTFKAPESQAMVEVGGTEDVWLALNAFVEAGGRIIILAQDYIPGHLPVTLMADGSTIGFVRSPNHPLVQGCQADDFMLWAPDHLISTCDLERPTRGAARVIVDAGGSTGMERAVLLEMPIAKGSYVFCQLPLVAKHDVEPIARQMLHRLIAYGAAAQPEERHCAMVIDKSGSLVKALTACGVRILPEGLRQLSVENVSALIMDASIPLVEEAVSAWRSYVEEGGTVWLHNPSQEFLAKHGLDWEGFAWEPGGVAPIHKVIGGPLSDGLRNEDLYWLADLRPVRYADWALMPEIANYVLRPKLTGDVTNIPAEEFNNSQVPITRRAPEGIWLSTRGTITAPLDIPRDGTYVIAVTAGGTPLQGIFPAYTVHVDKQFLGSFATVQAEPRAYTVSGQLTAGEHELRISFVNDQSNPPLEDRNGLVSGASFAMATPLPREIELLTEPPILFAVNRGKGRYLIDGINWPTSGLNASRATRLLCTLLTNLGVDARVALGGTPIPLADWTIDPNAAHARHEADGTVYLGSTSWVEGKVRFTKRGQYCLHLEARGTEMKGEFPELELSVDGRVLGVQHLLSQGWHDINFDVTVEAGEHVIRVRFTNDDYDPALHLDRNCWLRRLTISSAQQGR
ncbi:MAG: carbohydrate-binding domain-containing protein [Candidatus Zipacnadales bacterium]